MYRLAIQTDSLGTDCATPIIHPQSGITLQMKYQVSLEGNIERKRSAGHVQLNLYDTASLEEALKEVQTREHLPYDEAEAWIALLFDDKEQAIRDGVPEDQIEDLGACFSYKVKMLVNGL